MAPTILVAAATGNTGPRVVRDLSELLPKHDTLRGHRIIATTRSLNGAVAQELAKLPGVEVEEINWVDITADWLRQRDVVRVFIASHYQTNQFAEESAFNLAALHAGVKYLVRISTTAANVRPDCPAYYPRSHWAIEALLSSPEFERLQWTSLQPNAFTAGYVVTTAEFIKNFRKTGKQTVLKLAADKDAPVGIIHADDIGVVAARLLLEKDPTKHNKARYVLSGPEDVSGRQLVEMAEKRIGQRIENVVYRDMTFYDSFLAGSQESKNIIMSYKLAMDTSWAGLSPASTTSKEVLELAAPKTTAAEVLDDMLN